MYVKRAPIQLAVTMADDRCNLVDGLFLYGHQWQVCMQVQEVMSDGMSKKTNMQKREDEAMGGDGVVTMRHIQKKK